MSCLQKHQNSFRWLLVHRGQTATGHVWPRGSKVWRCYVWITLQVDRGSNGPCQLQLVSPLFVWRRCLLSTDGGLLTSVASDIPPSQQSVNLSASEGHWTRQEECIVFRKKPTVLLIVILSCGHLEKSGVWSEQCRWPIVSYPFKLTVMRLGITCFLVAMATLKCLFQQKFEELPHHQ